MVLLPVRKCYYIAKVSLLIILVVTLLALFEKWRGGKRAASAYLDPMEEKYEKQILEDEARIIPGLGEGGVAAYLTGEDKIRGEESEKKLAMNVYLSDRISYNRTLTDKRNPGCARVVYDAELPSASVILIFHNEPYSVVVRTIWSVINSCRRDQPWFKKANFVDKSGRFMRLGYPGQDPSSPLIYLKEIILVDDNSTLPELRGKLSHYVRTRLPPDLIRILRLPERVGLTRARLAGARYATGDVLVFLDAHCEAQPDWLRPQLQVIKRSPHAVVIPIIDSISNDNFYYSVQGSNDFQGLISARMMGARAARGDVLVFLDAHCESEADWLRPLLQRIRNKRDDVVTPVIDVINQSNFKLETAEVVQVGGFTFTGHFTWIDVPEREKKRRGSDIAPTWSPTMAGGLFAINRAYYWELGAYDEQMAGWGGENLEMSFRIWQCGGTLETVPCSRVGHVFRSFHPYSMPANSDTHGINTARMAEVWMDDFAELFYLYRPDLRKNVLIGDVTHRKVLRDKLQCKSFAWFLDNVYPDKYVPVRDAYAYGRFMNPSTGLCIDNMQRDELEAPLGLYPCHPSLQATQYLTLSLSHELRDEEQCAQLLFKRHHSEEEEAAGRKVHMASCHGKQRDQKWQYVPGTQQIRHMESGLCLDAGAGSGHDLLAKPCRATHAQRWNIDYSEENDFTLSNAVEATEQEMILRRLRGQRRKSRSLLSVPEPAQRRRHKHHKRSKKKRKNKFILKLVRTLANSTEQHVELDVHCKHTQLYPNNTFVRDLVTILNERNIKVINNGRVFERNKVTQLDQKHDKDRKVLYKMDVGEPLGEVQTVNKARKRKPNSKLIPETNAKIERTGASAHELHANMTSAAPRSHRIIIEDFVEMTPAPRSSSKRMKGRKRKRASTAAPAPAPEQDNNILELLTQNLASKLEEQITVSPHSEERESMEDAPMVSESETATHPHRIQKEKEQPRSRDKQIANKINDRRERDRHGERERDDVIPIDEDNDIDELWPIGESRARALRARRRHGRLEPALHDKQDEDSTVEEGGAEGAPVQVVVRSNLTFNLGEELLKWRAGDSPPDSELSIPKGRESPTPAWRLRDVTTREPDRHRHGERDVAGTGHIRKDTEERFSNSDSASGE